MTTQRQIKAACIAYDATNPVFRCDHFAMSAALKAAEAAAWDDISTAPKDGAPCWGWVPSYFQNRGGVDVILWQEGNWWSDGAFMTTPTHWRPLPAPPKV